MASRDQFQPEVFELTGGLDLVTPALSLAPGKLIDSLNYESDIHGGYRRMYGFERLDGRPSPSAQTYYIQAITLTGTIVAGNTVTGGTSGATAVVLQVNGTTELVVTKVTGTFVAEALKVGGVTQATVTTTLQAAATTALLHATYLGLTADNYRADIGKPPGSGPIRGACYFNGSFYAFRDNAGATAGAMYKSSSSGWTAVTLGQTIAFVQRSGTVTITIASPGVATLNNHGFANGQTLTLATTGALPTGLTVATTYYIVNATTNTFQFSLTSGGAAINTSGTQSGTHTVTFTGGQINDGDTITGAASGVTAVVGRSMLRTGTWTLNPVGTLQLDSATGTFTSGETLIVSGQGKVQASGANTAITLAPGGRYEFAIDNFSGATSTIRLYGVDGVNKAFEYDGTRYVPITTGLHSDTPQFLAVWKNVLVLAYDSIIETSGIGNPYSWTALTGASVIALGSPCSGLLPQAGTESVGALAIFASGLSGGGNRTFILYGNTSADFNLVQHAENAGAVPYTAQNIGYAYFLDTKGVCQINTTRNYGNFEMSTASRSIQPLIDQKRGLAKASCIIRGSNQYRIFFSDGTGISMYVKAADSNLYASTAPAQISSFMRFDYGSSLYMNTVWSGIDSSGIERTITGGSDGYVYELERGTSFDGAAITAHLLTAFNSSRSAMNRKTYKRTVFQATAQNTAQVTVGYNISYANIESTEGDRTAQQLTGGGSWWDIMTWDSFNWDAPYVTDYTIDTPGNGTNINFLIYGSTAIDQPYTIHSAIISRRIGRLER